MPLPQDLVHRLVAGRGLHQFRIGLGIMVLVTAVFGYNLRAFRNMSCQEAMDAAQLARNIAEGKGYTTLFIRPLSISLVKKVNPQTASPGGVADAARLKTMHPDLANPPVYPLLLAGTMKVLPFEFKLPAKPRPFWTMGGAFYRYQPDFLISLVNQVLFFLMIALLFFLARRLFDSSVAWFAAILVMATELFWHFTVSGLPTILLLLIFVGLVWCLVLFEEETRTPRRGPAGLPLLAALAGVCVGAGGLTRYAFGWLIVPVLLFLVLYGGPRRVLLTLTALVVFAGVMAPWLVRNLNVSGMPFGTATYAVLENTFLYPGNQLQRSLEPQIAIAPAAIWFKVPINVWVKLLTNLRPLVQSDLPKFCGSWVSAFFLVGLLISFRNPALRRIRYFLLFCLPVLALAQALGRTQLSEESPEINSENLLVLVAPVVMVYGVGLLFLLIEQINLALPELRFLVLGLFGLVFSLPMLLMFLPPRINPLSYPPYNPPIIQLVGGWMQPSELMMSDVPWAVAWYGQRQCVWLTLKATPDESDPNTHEDFLAINDYQKHIAALYLTPRMLDARFFSEWISAGEQSWGSFVLGSLVQKETPPAFPLHKMRSEWLLSGQLVFTDWERWRKQP
jgi:4-amino-4-deoxy-L-arabinose transferase-like glycosyltransferase